MKMWPESGVAIPVLICGLLIFLVLACLIFGGRKKYKCLVYSPRNNYGAAQGTSGETVLTCAERNNTKLCDDARLKGDNRIKCRKEACASDRNCVWCEPSDQCVDAQPLENKAGYGEPMHLSDCPSGWTAPELSCSAKKKKSDCNSCDYLPGDKERVGKECPEDYSCVWCTESNMCVPAAPKVTSGHIMPIFEDGETWQSCARDWDSTSNCDSCDLNACDPMLNIPADIIKSEKLSSGDSPCKLCNHVPGCIWCSGIAKCVKESDDGKQPADETECSEHWCYHPSCAEGRVDPGGALGECDTSTSEMYKGPMAVPTDDAWPYGACAAFLNYYADAWGEPITGSHHPEMSLRGGQWTIPNPNSGEIPGRKLPVIHPDSYPNDALAKTRPVPGLPNLRMPGWTYMVIGDWGFSPSINDGQPKNSEVVTQNIQWAVANIMKNDPLASEVDFIINTGDSFYGSHRGIEEWTLGWKNVYGEWTWDKGGVDLITHKPWYGAMGNHDIWPCCDEKNGDMDAGHCPMLTQNLPDSVKEAIPGIQNVWIMGKNGKDPYLRVRLPGGNDKPDLLIVLMDTNAADDRSPYDGDIKRFTGNLDKAIADIKEFKEDNPNGPVLVVQHYPLNNFVTLGTDETREKAWDFLSKIKGWTNITIYSGHVHYNTVDFGATGLDYESPEAKAAGLDKHKHYDLDPLNAANGNRAYIVGGGGGYSADFPIQGYVRATLREDKSPSSAHGIEHTIDLIPLYCSNTGVCLTLDDAVKRNYAPEGTTASSFMDPDINNWMCSHDKKSWLQEFRTLRGCPECESDGGICSNCFDPADPIHGQDPIKDKIRTPQYYSWDSVCCGADYKMLPDCSGKEPNAELLEIQETH